MDLELPLVLCGNLALDPTTSGSFCQTHTQEMMARPYLTVQWIDQVDQQRTFVGVMIWSDSTRTMLSLSKVGPPTRCRCDTIAVLPVCIKRRKVMLLHHAGCCELRS